MNNLKITAEGVPEEVRLAGDSTVANVTNQFPGVFKARFSPRQSKRADRSAEIRRFVCLAGCVVLSFFSGGAGACRKNKINKKRVFLQFFKCCKNTRSGADEGT